jgi:putative transposase
LSASERAQVRDLLNSERFGDSAPRQVYATLLDEGIYHCHWRTMYRILAEHDEVRERRNQLTHPNYARPELLATQPNELWSWDITKLKGPVKYTYFYLYVMLDVFSRYVVGWLLAVHESKRLGQKLLSETCQKERIAPDQLTIHADRGNPMRAKSLALLLSDLGVVKTHSRPYTATDNPYSEAQFKTMKYRPDYPRCFGSIQDARVWARSFFDWYNHQHRHTGIGLMTPAVVHAGLAPAVMVQRQRVLQVAYEQHPERFVKGPPILVLMKGYCWRIPFFSNSRGHQCWP